MESIAGIFKNKKQNTVLGMQVEASRVVDLANELFAQFFGKENAEHVRPLFLKNKTLTVSCTSSVIAQEIRLNQANIVEAINKKIGEEVVDRIRYLI